MLLDSYQRLHKYLRISITDRCNYRCVYCMPAEGIKWKPKQEILTYEEIARLVHIFAQLGIQHIRITGGEPTLRSDICSLIAALNQIEGIQDISMTTNGHLLPKLAKPLAEAGLKRINISMDSLQKERFSTLTRGGNISKVLEGIQQAKQHGISPIKINCVMLRGVNEDELFDFIDFCAQEELVLRIIEYMPFEARWHQCIPEAELISKIQQFYELRKLPNKTGVGPAKYHLLVENNLRIGFISPLSQRFCEGCNRLRLMADGHLRTCLAHEDTPSLREYLRNRGTDQDIAHTIQKMVLGKAEGHFCGVEDGQEFEGIMTQIGG